MCGLNSDVIFVGFEVLMTCVVTLGGVLGIGSSVHVGNCVEVRLCACVCVFGGRQPRTCLTWFCPVCGLFISSAINF